MGSAHEVALVTGASRGIGRAIAERLGRGGYRVAVNYREAVADAEATVARIRDQGGEAHAFQADVSRAEDAEALVRSVQEHFGGLDVLVNNAGIARDTLLLRMRPEEWDAVIQTNLSSVYHCTRAALKHMVRQRYGRIVSITSIAGLVGNAGQANYAAAKAGIIGFTKSVAKEWASRGITVNAVAPGFIDTDMTRALSDTQRDTLLAHVPLGRFGQPEDVAEAVWYLIHASYVTGQVLVVDGGLAMQ
jgi:3-oxoacyl-[acyl-carrier protein] reductase